MTRRSVRWRLIAVVAIAALAGGVVVASLPTTAEDYRDAAVTDARDAASAVGTAALLGDHSDRAPGTFTDAALSDARDGVTTALGDVADLDVPDDASRELRDRLLPLLHRAVAAIGDASRAAGDGDPTTLGDAVTRLHDVHAALQDFVRSAS